MYSTTLETSSPLPSEPPRFDPTAVALVVTPLSSNGTWLMFLPAVTTGATLVIVQGFDPAQLLALAKREGVTHTFMVPTHYQALVQRVGATPGNRVATFRIMVSAGAPLTRGVKEAVLRLLGEGCWSCNGLTEGIATGRQDKRRHRSMTVRNGGARCASDAHQPGLQTAHRAARALAPDGSPPVNGSRVSDPSERTRNAPIVLVPLFRLYRKRPLSVIAISIGALPSPALAVRPSTSSSSMAPSKSMAYPEIDPLPVLETYAKRPLGVTTIQQAAV